MIYTYTGSRNLYGDLTQNSTSTNLTLGDTLINADLGRLFNLRPWHFLNREGTGSTVANQAYIEIPANIAKVRTVQIQQGTNLYGYPQFRESPNRQHWESLNTQTPTSYTSTVPEWWYVFNGRIYIWPTPSAAGTTTVYGRVGFTRLNIADYTTGTISTATSGSTTVVGASTVWTAGMVGQWIRITATSAASGGDDRWYEIASRTSNTQIDLVKNYQGTSISSGSANYTIGQVSFLPDGFQETPIYRATQVYLSKIDATRSSYFKGLADDLEAALISEHGSATDNVLVEDGGEESSNPNLYVTL